MVLVPVLVLAIAIVIVLVLVLAIVIVILLVIVIVVTLKVFAVSKEALVWQIARMHLRHFEHYFISFAALV